MFSFVLCSYSISVALCQILEFISKMPLHSKFQKIYSKNFPLYGIMLIVEVSYFPLLLSILINLSHLINTASLSILAKFAMSYFILPQTLYYYCNWLIWIHKNKYQYTVYGKTFEGENFQEFCGVEATCKHFPKFFTLPP